MKTLRWHFKDFSGTSKLECSSRNDIFSVEPCLKNDKHAPFLRRISWLNWQKPTAFNDFILKDALKTELKSQLEYLNQYVQQLLTHVGANDRGESNVDADTCYL